VVVDVIVDAGSVCTHNFGEAPGYTLHGHPLRARTGERQTGKDRRQPVYLHTR
jgi:hypothetical protein